ncbi:Uncharacterized protein BANIM336_00195 [Bifidobacterium animalis subsp. animalis IM386]|uniref:Uncharacterized protein n=1 Tax=Bifidobacterium animalis subsp. animalis IM386 TaxID=1402194 RepID=A0AAV2W233_9BIFI|nr:Uncharacterized protein BANIM336_00195 [Bifidobacterium animalis subsp. animalis IM386]
MRHGIWVYRAVARPLSTCSAEYAIGGRLGVLCGRIACAATCEGRAKREKPAGLKPPANREKREKGSVIRDSEWNLVGFLSIADGYHYARRPLTHRVFSLRIRWVCSYRHTAGQV